LTAKLAVFDGMPEDLDYNPHNISWHLNSNDGYLTFAELNVADFKFGAYYHNHSFYSEGADSSVPNYGAYLTADHTLIRFSAERQLNAFLQFSLSPASKNDNNWYLGGGIHCTGPIAGRSDDEFGLAFARANLQHSANGSETTLETTYKLNVCKQVFLQPDLQYILHPAGTDGTPANALAAILRFGIEF
jgi:porin